MTITHINRFGGSESYVSNVTGPLAFVTETIFRSGKLLMEIHNGLGEF